MSSRVLVIDFETANSSATSACAIGAILIEDDVITRQYYTLIKPPSKVFQFTYIHGITWEQVKDAPTFKEMWNADFSALYEAATLIVGHNIQFDARVLKATAEHHQVKLPEKPTECTVRLARNQLEIKPAKLDHVCKTLEIPLEHHQALSDSLASAYIYLYAKTGEKPWLTGRAPTKQYEFLMDDLTPFTALPAHQSPLSNTSRKISDPISKLNSAESRATLEALLKKNNL